MTCTQIPYILLYDIRECVCAERLCKYYRYSVPVILKVVGTNKFYNIIFANIVVKH